MLNVLRGVHPPAPEHTDVIASGVWVLAHPPAAVPAVVLAAGTHGAPPDPGFEALWQELQRQQAGALGARFVPAPDAGHFIHQDRPALVVDSIRGVAEAARDPASGATPAASPTA